MEKFSPSVCFNGFIDEDWCPMLLGKGFGPKPYLTLIGLWNRIESKDSGSYTEPQITAVTSLLKDMQACKNSEVYEGVISGIISGSVGMLLPLFGSESSLRAVHQTFVPCKTASSVDISLMNYANEKTVHAFIEVRWLHLDNKFPEAQACAYAESFYNTQSYLKQRWAPIFVLSKTLFRFGVAFLAFSMRWSYSEIFECSCSRGEFSPEDPADVLSFARLLDFLVQSAEYHKGYAGSDAEQTLLVNGQGDALLSSSIEIIGDRVIKGKSESGKTLVAKFYPNKQTAENAAKQQKQILAVLKQKRDPEIFQGCSGPRGLYVVIEDFVTSASVVTRSHMINLTNIVDQLHSNGFVHGDLRPQNIVFEDADTVTLIDFEWAGAAGIAKFPVNVIANNFGEAGSHVFSNSEINSNFDWYCLSEIMKLIKCPSASRAALNCKKDAVVSALRKMPKDSDFGSILIPLRSMRRYLNLSRLDKRLEAYYADRRKRDRSEGGSDELEVGSAARRRST